MPDFKHPTEVSDHRPAPQPAALAALTIGESLILALIESGVLDARTARRCLLDAVAAHERKQVFAEAGGAVEAEAAKLIESLLRQIEAAAPSRRGGETIGSDTRAR